MSFRNNRSVLEKADAALADLVAGGGYLKPAQAKKFMRLMITQSELLKMVTAVPMAAPQQEYPQIQFGSRILRPAAEATALTQAERSKPDFSFVALNAKKFKAEVWLTDEMLEDNIEQGQLNQTIMQLITERVSTDVEEVAINGDSASSDSFLAQMDGVLKQAKSHLVDAAGAPISKDLLTDILKTVPSQYLRNKKQFRHLTSVDAELDYRNKLSERATGVGDKFLETDAPVMHSGVPIAPIPLFPENLGANNDQTSILTCDPKNIYLGIWRQIKVEHGRDISAGIVKVVVTLRFDVTYADERAVAKAVNVQLN